MLRVIIMAALATLSVGSTPASTRNVVRFTNPVIDADFPDPTVIRASDGYFYVYATQGGGTEGKPDNVQVARSKDLSRWQRLPDALPRKPGWALRTQDFWAPHVVERDGRYILYYSAKPDAALADQSQGLCLAVAVADKPAGPFTDRGSPLLCGTGFVNIDPMVFDDPVSRKTFLYWGSGFEPIRVRELAADALDFAPGSVATDLVNPGRAGDLRAFPRLVEGAWVLKREAHYYLFYSGDNCCGAEANYATMVARSKSPTGPFVTLEETEHVKDSIILAASERWRAPGHNSVVENHRGSDWIIYHAVDAKRPRTNPADDINTRRVMLIDRLVWRNGWPRLASAPR